MGEENSSLTALTVAKSKTGDDTWIEKGTEADILLNVIRGDSEEETFMSTVEALMDIKPDVAKEYFKNPSSGVDRDYPSAVQRELARIRTNSQRYENVRLRSKEKRKAIMSQKPYQMASPYSPDEPARPDVQLVNLVRNSLKNYRIKQREIV